MLKKAYKYIFTLLSILLLSPIAYRPFSISANTYMNFPPFVGINASITQYDLEYRTSFNTSSGTFSTSGGSNNAISMGEGTLSNGRSYYSTGLAGGGIQLNGTINLNMSSSNTEYIKRVITFDIILDDDYIGYVNAVVTNSGNTLYNEDISVNGNIASFTLVDSNSSVNPDIYNISLQNYTLIKNNSKERWTFPLESYNFVSYGFKYNSLSNIDRFNDYYLPIFNLKVNDKFMRVQMQSNTSQWVVVGLFGILPLGVNDLLNMFTTQLTLSDYSVLYPINISSNNSENGRIIKFKVTNNTSQPIIEDIIYKFNRTIRYMPIYFNYVEMDNISIDFALQFGLSNKLLDNLDIIANGTQNSNNSSDNLENSNSQVSDVVSQYDNLESNFNDSLNSSLNNINTSLTPSAMGSKFQASAIWVRTQFNRMTNNTPFGSIMGFSLLLGLSLLIIGKINK